MLSSAIKQITSLVFVGGSNGALREQATSGREAGFRVESGHPWGCRPGGRGRRPVDRRIDGTKETTSNTPHGRGSGRYANSPRARAQRDRRGSSVRGAPGHGVGEDALTTAAQIDAGIRAGQPRGIRVSVRASWNALFLTLGMVGQFPEPALEEHESEHDGHDHCTNDDGQQRPHRVQGGAGGGGDHEGEAVGRADQSGESALFFAVHQQGGAGGVARHCEADSQADEGDEQYVNGTYCSARSSACQRQSAR